MNSISFHLKSGDNNEEVVNLKAALIALIERQLLGLGTEDSSNFPLLLNAEVGYGESTQRLVAVFQRMQQLPDSGMVNKRTADAFNVILSQLGLLSGPSDGQGKIGGVIYMDYGIPANNVKLRLYSKGFAGNDAIVKEVNTDDQGKYAFNYDPAAVTTASFEVRSVDAEGKEHSLSSTLFNSDKAVAITNLNLIAPSVVQQQQESEFARLSKDLTGIIGDIAKLNEAQEKEERQDITFLSQNTNWDARPIALASLAGSLSGSTGLTQEAAYALVRAGLPTDADQLAQINVDDINHALKTAAESGIVALNEEGMKAAASAFQTFANKIRLGTKDFSSLSTYDDLLTNQQLTDDEKSVFANSYFSSRKNAAELWQKAKDAGITDDKIKGLQLQGKLGMLTANNAPLVQNLQSVVGSPDQLSKLVDEELYEPEAWDAKLKTLAGSTDDNAEAIDKLIPPAYVGGTIAERKQAYANDMAAKVREAFPEKVVRNRIEKGKIVLGDSATQSGVSNFLQKSEELGYKLGSTHIDKFVKEQEATLFSDITEDQKQTAITGVKLLHRIHQVTPNDESMQVLLELGHASAQDIVSVPREDFVARFAKNYSDKFKVAIDEGIRMGRVVYNKSQQVQTTTYSLFTATQTMHQTPPVFAISGTPEKLASDKERLSEKIKGAPNLQQLFGSLDFCECEHCRSVLSPAAYLVDLLQFLDRKQTDWQYFLDKWKTDHAGEEYEAKYTKPYDALIDRRPDLVNLPLTCQNTNTALPYIDIVNEILEYYLVNKKLTTEIAHDTGDATTAELLAEPVNVEPKAYGILKEAVYPLNLPFDLWLETVRQFCNHYEINLSQVLETLQPIGVVDFATEQRIAIESLNISPAEFALLINEDPLPSLFNLYGYASDPEMTAGLKSAKQLANRLGVSYKELLNLVQTEFINPQLGKAQVLHKMGVSVNDVFRFKKVDGFRNFSVEEEQAFNDKLEQVTALYGTDAKAALEDSWNQGVFKDLLLLNDTNAGCNFDATLVGYADRDALKFDWLKLNLFVRLWKRLGWSMEETDRALAVFFPQNLRSILNNTGAAETERSKALASGLKSALVNIAHLIKLASKTNVGKQAFLKLSTIWGDIPTLNRNSLYSQLFLTRSVLKIDTAFDDALGQYLSKDLNIKTSEKDHSIALQAALNISADDLVKILKDNGLEIGTTKLSLTNVSLLYRYVVLAKALKLSISDLITFKQLSGLDPFAPVSADPLQVSEDDHFSHQTLQFTDWVSKTMNSGFKLDDLAYLFMHRFDSTGKYRNIVSDAAEVTKLLSDEIKRITELHSLPANPSNPNDLTPFTTLTDDLLEQKLSLITSASTVEHFMAMWTGRRLPDWNIVKDDLGSFLSEERFNGLFVGDAEDANDSIKQSNTLQKKSVIAGVLLPFLQQKLIRQAILEILSTNLKSLPSRIEWLINDAANLHIPPHPDFPLIEIFGQADDASQKVSLQQAYILLSKAIQLTEGFNLSDKELHYFKQHASDFDDFDLSRMPIEEDNALANVQGLFKNFIRLIDYQTLRNDLAAGADDLIRVFGKAKVNYDNVADIPAKQSEHLNTLFNDIAKLSRRDISVVAEVATILGIQAIAENTDTRVSISATAFADERGISLLWRALKLVQIIGIPTGTLAEVAQIGLSGSTEEKYQAIAEGFKNGVKARYESEAWQQVAQPIFDKLRQQRRNALVAYMLHNFRDLFGSMEEMYEFFLVDPGTEPVVQTSRIRIATASVQLFIQRCLLNLESRWAKKVRPAAINAEHWKWMNRYRVWEANRKIFLWPENWLEPEWRDDKTHLFKELEGKLLQGDVSNELVEDAFYIYLKKLEELARLDIVAVYCEENPLTPDVNTLHVVGRTYGFPHKYFYRKYAQQMWTPWEPVDVEIDGDHIVCIVWRGRFHLLWTTFIEKISESSVPSAGNNAETNLSNWKVSDALSTVTGGTQKKIMEAHLHWSDYYQGKWSTKQSGGVNNPVSGEVAINTTPKNVAISITKESNISEQMDGALRISLRGLGAFRLLNKNSPPEIIDADTPPAWKFSSHRKIVPYSVNRLTFPSNGPLAISYPHLIKIKNGEEQQSDSTPQTILGKTSGKFNIVPCSVPVTIGGEEFGPMITPFFYQDSWYTFYIEPALTETITINEWDEWVGGPPVRYEHPKMDWNEIKMEPYYPWPKNVPVPKNADDPAWIDPEDPRVKVTPMKRRDWVTNPGTFVKFGERVIGKDAGLNVFVRNSNSNLPELVKKGSELNRIIHNATETQKILLVPANRETVSPDTIVSNGHLTGEGDTLNTGAILVGGAGVTTTRPVTVTTEAAGIFSKNPSITKRFNRL
ncbi:hypothetical protein GZH53_09040 [Flavihumibacter sp. R14]|nr:hypothetical protein [Flavihumibacter soli]